MVPERGIGVSGSLRDGSSAKSNGHCGGLRGGVCAGIF
jgi:hypothetical protein